MKTLVLSQRGTGYGTNTIQLRIPDEAVQTLIAVSQQPANAEVSFLWPLATTLRYTGGFAECPDKVMAIKLLRNITSFGIIEARRFFEDSAGETLQINAKTYLDVPTLLKDFSDAGITFDQVEEA